MNQLLFVNTVTANVSQQVAENFFGKEEQLRLPYPAGVEVRSLGGWAYQLTRENSSYKVVFSFSKTAAGVTVTEKVFASAALAAALVNELVDKKVQQAFLANLKQMVQRCEQLAGKRALIIYAHPAGKSFSYNEQILKQTINTLNAHHYQIEIRDLYALAFDPVLKEDDFQSYAKKTVPEAIQREQTFIQEADLLLFISPIWWASFPAMMKGYLDRVFTYGFAYGADDTGQIRGLLNEKRGLIINTFGNSSAYYEQSGMLESFEHTMLEGIFGFSGVQSLGLLSYGNTNSQDTQVLENLLRHLNATLTKLL